jgi:hypothetical protein
MLVNSRLAVRVIRSSRLVMAAVTPASRPCRRKKNRKFDFNRPFLQRSQALMYCVVMGGTGLLSTHPLHMSALLKEAKLEAARLTTRWKEGRKEQRERAASRGYPPAKQPSPGGQRSILILNCRSSRAQTASSASRRGHRPEPVRPISLPWAARLFLPLAGHHWPIMVPTPMRECGHPPPPLAQTFNMGFVDGGRGPPPSAIACLPEENTRCGRPPLSMDCQLLHNTRRSTGFDSLARLCCQAAQY